MVIWMLYILLGWIRSVQEFDAADALYPDPRALDGLGLEDDMAPKGNLART
jgi:hypothetical protein